MPRLHSFLRWLGPAIIGGIAATAGLLLAAAAIWPAVKTSTEAAYRLAVTSISEPLFWVLAVLIVAAYSGFLYWSWPNRPRRTQAAASASPQLYVQSYPSGTPEGIKSYIVVWSPGEYFHPVFSDYQSRAQQWPPAPPVETALTFHVFNAGPGPVRHLTVTWELPELDIPDLLAASGLFGDTIDSVSPSRVTLLKEGVGWSDLHFAAKDHAKIALIADAEVAELRAPPAFNWAFAIYTLSEAKRLTSEPSSRASTTTLREAREAMNNSGAAMRPITLRLNYVTDGGLQRTERFSITGYIRGNIHTASSRSSGEHVYEPVPEGISAWVDYLEVTPQ